MDTTKIPQGDQVLTVELTVKELIALTGVRFNHNNAVKASAHRKLRSALKQTIQNESTTDKY